MDKVKTNKNDMVSIQLTRHSHFLIVITGYLVIRKVIPPQKSTHQNVRGVRAWQEHQPSKQHECEAFVAPSRGPVGHPTRDQEGGTQQEEHHGRQSGLGGRQVDPHGGGDGRAVALSPPQRAGRVDVHAAAGAGLPDRHGPELERSPNWCVYAADRQR
jgi:hypothetical protein